MPSDAVGQRRQKRMPAHYIFGVCGGLVVGLRLRSGVRHVVCVLGMRVVAILAQGGQGLFMDLAGIRFKLVVPCADRWGSARRLERFLCLDGSSRC